MFQEKIMQRDSSRKMIPNVSLEWIKTLKQKLPESTYCHRGKSTKTMPNASKGFPAAITTSTAGMSFNSPPATERVHGYDVEGDTDEPNYYGVDPVQLFKSGKRTSFINIQNFDNEADGHHQSDH